MSRILGYGILKRGFTINNSVCRIKLPKNTAVSFQYSEEKTQEIHFEGFPDVFLFRSTYRNRIGKWLSSVYGRVMTVHFDESKTPYPISYFSR